MNREFSEDKIDQEDLTTHKTHNERTWGKCIINLTEEGEITIKEDTNSSHIDKQTDSVNLNTMDEVDKKSLQDLPNIGKELAKQLQQAGIYSYQDLIDAGSVEALLRIKGRSGKGCYNMLYALEGAIQGIRWHNLSREDKDRLKAELDKSMH